MDSCFPEGLDVNQPYFTMKFDNQLLTDKARGILEELEGRPIPYTATTAQENVGSKKSGETRNSTGFKKPHLANIVTSNIPPAPSLLRNSSISGFENYGSECFFPGLVTPEDPFAAKATSEITIEKLRQLAKILSPLTSRSSTNSSNETKYPRVPNSSPASSHTRSYTSSFGSSLQNYSSNTTNDSDPPKEKTSSWNSVPVVSYRTVPTPAGSFPLAPLRAWGISNSQSYFDLYKPVNFRYPSVWEFADIRSPVVRINSSAVHNTFSMIWEKLDIALAQEIWQWGNVFEQVRDRTLFKLSAISRNRDYMTTKSHEIWKTFRYKLQELVKAMCALYTKQFGKPLWATSDAHIIQFLYTCDTCFSRENTDDNQVIKDDNQIEKYVEVAMKFGPDNAQVRRYMRQIIIDPCHIYATAGEDFELHLSLWDPHRTFDELKSTTTFELQPKIPWLHYNAKSHSLIGRVPVTIGVVGGSSHYQLELGLIAHVVDILPKGVERKITIQAKVNIWVLEEEDNEHTVNLFKNPGDAEEMVFFPSSFPSGSIETPMVGTNNGEPEIDYKDKSLHTHNSGNLNIECNSIWDDYYECPPEKHDARENTLDNSTWQDYYEHPSHNDVPSAPETSVVTILPQLAPNEDILGGPSRSTAVNGETRNPLFIFRNDSLSTLAGGEEYEENALGSWMQNAMVAKRLQDRNESEKQITEDGSCFNTPTPSVLAMSNEFWDLATESEEGRERRLSAMYHGLSSGGGDDTDNIVNNQSALSSPFKVYTPVRASISSMFVRDEWDTMWIGYYDIVDDLNLDSDSIFATGASTPRSISPDRYEDEDDDDQPDREFLEPLARCGPHFSL